MQVTEASVRMFERDGFLLMKRFASADLCREILQKAEAAIDVRCDPIETEEAYLGKETDKVPTLRRLRQVYDRDPLFAAWMTDRSIRPVLGRLLNDTPVLTLAHHNSIMSKMPAASVETCWHQDIRYWKYAVDNLISVWLALGEERIENGVLEFIPGSHKLALAADRFDAKVCFRNDLEANRALIAQRTHIDLEAGDVVLFHCKTLHHAYPNLTAKPKISFVYTVRGSKNLPLPGTRSSAHGEIVLGLEEDRR